MVLLVSFRVATVGAPGHQFSDRKKAMVIGGDRHVATGSPPIREYEESPGNNSNLEFNNINIFGISRDSRGRRETSDAQSTNLGVRSSNLFGRATQSLGNQTQILLKAKSPKFLGKFAKELTRNCRGGGRPACCLVRNGIPLTENQGGGFQQQENIRMFQFVEDAETGEALDAVESVGTAFLDRIVTTDAGGQIASLDDLVRFARVRYPDHYASDPWKMPLDKP